MEHVQREEIIKESIDLMIFMFMNDAFLVN